MDVIEAARLLGEALIRDERCRRLNVAKAANDADMALQEKIGAFNLQKFKLNGELSREGCDPEKAKQLRDELSAQYKAIMETEGMKEFEAAKKDVDELLGHINSIIQMSVTGEVGGACSGSCEGCAGCH